MKAAVPLKQADSICFDLWGKQYYYQRVPKTAVVLKGIFLTCKSQTNQRKKTYFHSACFGEMLIETID